LTAVRRLENSKLDLKMDDLGTMSAQVTGEPAAKQQVNRAKARGVEWIAQGPPRLPPGN
jgi:hypothetical protein